MTEEDLIQNPQFCKLLATLAQHVDQTGLTAPLKTELDKVSVVPVPICSYLFLFVFINTEVNQCRVLKNNSNWVMEQFFLYFFCLVLFRNEES